MCQLNLLNIKFISNILFNPPYTHKKEIKILPQHDPQLVILNLMRIPDLTNCTRLRLWQPVHAGITQVGFTYIILFLHRHVVCLTGEGLDTWAIDGLVLHSTTPLGVILTSDFQQLNDQGSSWLTWFGGQLHSFCSRSR